MGFGFPAAIGAKVAKPNVNVFLIDGDGSFQMTIQELGTVKEAGIKVIPIIMNNSYLGMVRQWLELFSDKRYSEVYLGTTPNFTKVAEAYGLKGIRVEKKSELGPALKQAMKNVYFDTAASPFLYSPEIYNQVSQLVGADKILFGSDYPVLAQTRLLQEINSADLPEEAKSLILYGNARRLLEI